MPYLHSIEVDEDAEDGVIAIDPDRICPGYRLYTTALLSRADLIDEAGEIINTWQYTPRQRWERVDLLDNGDVLVVGARLNPHDDEMRDEDRYVARLSWHGDVIWQYDILSHHDLELAPDGNIMVMTYIRKRIPEIARNIDVRDDYLTLIDGKDGTVLAERSLLEATRACPVFGQLDRVRPNKLGSAPWLDFFHSNSVEWMVREELFDQHELYDPDHVLISIRNQHRVVILDWSKNKIVWSWGGKGILHAQHDAMLLENGNITIFDNRVGRDWSRVIEVDPRTDEIVWEYIADPPQDFYTKSRGSSHRLPNGNTLISQSDSGRIFEVTKSGDVVWDFLCPHRIEPDQRPVVARAFWYSHEMIDPLRAKYANKEQ